MSVNIVNQTTGDLTQVAGNATDKVGNLSAATTTDKSSVVAMVNEVNGFFVNLGAITANDWTNFFKNACAAFHALNPKTYVVHNVFLSWGGTRYGGQLIDYGDAVDFTITGGGGATLYCGYSMLTGAGKTKFFTYMNSDKAYSLVSLDSTYNAGTDWNIVKQGNICVMNMRNLKDIPTGLTVIGTIPVGFRPEWGFYEYVYAANKDVHVGFNIADNGDIQIINNTGATLSGTVYVNRNITYFTA
jgi:hypothetical protein